jgi:predicted ribosomally synthesized peptide with nif11-like leader
MSVESVKKFYEAVARDEELKSKFAELTKKYQGQPMDAAKAMNVIEQEAMPIAKQMGYSFSIEDLKSYGQAMQQAKINGELSDEELRVVAGGADAPFSCGILGNGGGGQEFCLFVG